jgi:putative ABC transport system ATP-binding protein
MPPDKARPGPPLIALDHVSKVYGAGEVAVHALDDVSLTIAEGEFVAIMGPSGSGKSTAMNVIGCLDTPTSGDYLFQGVEVGQMARNQRALIRRNLIGFVFQHFNLLARTSALNNVALPLLYSGMPPAERHAHALKRLTQVGLAGRLDHQPTQLSGGQQQRVAIARALVNDPQLVLADEPTGALDSRTGIEIVALLQALNREGITIVLVTHEHDIAAFARRIIHFRDGRVVEDVPNTPLDAAAAMAEMAA